MRPTLFLLALALFAAGCTDYQQMRHDREITELKQKTLSLELEITRERSKRIAESGATVSRFTPAPSHQTPARPAYRPPHRRSTYEPSQLVLDSVKKGNPPIILTEQQRRYWVARGVIPALRESDWKIPRQPLP